MYTHLFFDLDRTLWDFETNSREVLQELALKYRFAELGIPCTDTFIKEYVAINEILWAEYREDRIDKETLRYDRFHRALMKYGVADRDLSVKISNDYTLAGPTRTRLFPGAIEVLEQLSKKYTLHIITNGFEETQHRKIESSGLKSYFREVITSDRAGYKKPDKRIFEYSLAAAKAECASSLMIGDCPEADVRGAREAGMHQVFFNPSATANSYNATYEISRLEQLLEIL